MYFPLHVLVEPQSQITYSKSSLSPSRRKTAKGPLCLVGGTTDSSHVVGWLVGLVLYLPELGFSYSACRAFTYHMIDASVQDLS